MRKFKSIFILIILSIILMLIHILGVHIIGDIKFTTSPYFWPIFICAILSAVLFLTALYKFIKIFISL